ncbi:Hypothetical predicted protein [Cloeon dipterum]|uniref:C-type lectin domain-containing protein n=1 Tax=Cloeon dipterum TaxID=197152 RepID=A0A8S1CXD2_9INSE|nr:Hypothetical predicted protein [Cloeon dipterum]
MRLAILILVLATIPCLTLSLQEEGDDVCTIGMMLLQGISRKLRDANLVPTEHTKEEIINDVESIKSSLGTVNDQLSKMNRNLECLKGSTLKWIRLESGKKYYFSDFYKYTWYDAKEFCKNSGGVLASTRNEDELKTIYEANPISSSKPWVFVSATDIGQNPGNFYWADGSTLDRNSSMWLEDSDPDAYGQAEIRHLFIYWHRPERLSKPRIWLERDGLVIRDVTPDLDPFVVDYMVKNYMTEEPMSKALKSYEDSVTVDEHKFVYEKLVLPDRVSIIVLQKDTPGAGLEEVSAKNPPNIVGLNLLFVTAKTFFETGALVDVFERYGVDLYLDGAGMSVALEWRGKGIGGMMLEARCNLCRELGIPLTKTVFTSIQSQKVAIKGGFELLGELIYADIKKEDGQPRFPDMAPDQRRIQLMAMRIT